LMRRGPAFWRGLQDWLSELPVAGRTRWEAASRFAAFSCRPYCAPVVPRVRRYPKIWLPAARKTPLRWRGRHLVSRGAAGGIFVTAVTGSAPSSDRCGLPSSAQCRSVGDEAPCLPLMRRLGARGPIHGSAPQVAAGAQTSCATTVFRTPDRQTLSFLVVDAGYGFGNGRLSGRPFARDPHPRACPRRCRCAARSRGAAGLSGPRGIGETLPVRARGSGGPCRERLVGTRLLAFADRPSGEIPLRHCLALGAELVGTRSVRPSYIPRGESTVCSAPPSVWSPLVTTAKTSSALPPQMRRHDRGSRGRIRC